MTIVLRDKRGIQYNPEKIWGIEAGTYFKSDPSRVLWFMWKKYKTQKAMLEAFNYYKNCGYEGIGNEIGWIYRPVHVNYPNAEPI